MSDKPLLSVIVPANNAEGILPRSLGALRNSDLPRDRWELVLVDDGSSDDTSLIAARYADTVVTLPGKPHGPAYARNRGFEVSRGEIIVFIDADCVAHTDTLSRFVALFDTQLELGAAFGSYDDRPPASKQVFSFHMKRIRVRSSWNREAGAESGRTARFFQRGSVSRCETLSSKRFWIGSMPIRHWWHTARRIGIGAEPLRSIAV